MHPLIDQGLTLALYGMSTVFVLLVVVGRRWFSSSFEDRARDRERRSRWPEEERNARARVDFHA